MNAQVEPSVIDVLTRRFQSRLQKPDGDQAAKVLAEEILDETQLTIGGFTILSNRDYAVGLKAIDLLSHLGSIGFPETRKLLWEKIIHGWLVEPHGHKLEDEAPFIRSISSLTADSDDERNKLYSQLRHSVVNVDRKRGCRKLLNFLRVMDWSVNLQEGVAREMWRMLVRVAPITHAPMVGELVHALGHDPGLLPNDARVLMPYIANSIAKGLKTVADLRPLRTAVHDWLLTAPVDHMLDPELASFNMQLESERSACFQIVFKEGDPRAAHQVVVDCLTLLVKKWRHAQQKESLREIVVKLQMKGTDFEYEHIIPVH